MTYNQKLLEIVEKLDKKVGFHKSYGADIALEFVLTEDGFNTTGLIDHIAVLKALYDECECDDLEMLIDALEDYETVKSKTDSFEYSVIVDAWERIDWPKWIVRNDPQETIDDINSAVKGITIDYELTDVEASSFKEMLVAQSNYIISVENALSFSLQTI